MLLDARGGGARIARLFALALGLILLYVGQRASRSRSAARRLTVTRTIDRREVQEGRPITLRFEVGGLRGLPVRVEALGAGGAWHALEDGTGERPRT